jgi:hypothetical protein
VHVDTVNGAVKIARYLIPHALTVFHLMGTDPAVSDASYILAWMRRTTPERFTPRDLFTDLPRGRFAKVGLLDAPLAVLESHGYVRRLPPPRIDGRPGRPPSPTYEVNPLALSAESAESAEPPPQGAGNVLRPSAASAESAKTSPPPRPAPGDRTSLTVDVADRPPDTVATTRPRARVMRPGDWSYHEEPLPCVDCGRLAWMRDPDGRPRHKVDCATGSEAPRPARPADDDAEDGRA